MRDITKLHPELQEKLKKLQTECTKQGLKIGISECVRTVAEQDALYAKGRTTSGSIVTNAKGYSYSSMHQWGVAFDFYRNDGKGAYNDSDGFFSKVGKIGQNIGLEWGGAWKSIIDKPHFQLPQWGSTTSKLKSLYKTPDAFFASWNALKYPCGTYTIQKTTYLLSEPKNGKYEPYKALSDTMKEKCKNANGNAKLVIGKNITIAKAQADNSGTFCQLKCGLWIKAENNNIGKA